MRNLASLDASGLGAKPDLAEGLGAASAALLERLRGVPSVDNVAERSRQPIGHVVRGFLARSHHPAHNLHALP